MTNPPGNLWRDKWTALSGPLSRLTALASSVASTGLVHGRVRAGPHCFSVGKFPLLRVRSHVERRCCNLGPTQSRISPSILQYTKIYHVSSHLGQSILERASRQRNLPHKPLTITNMITLCSNFCWCSSRSDGKQPKGPFGGKPNAVLQTSFPAQIRHLF